MKSKKKIAVIGGTGKSGKYLVRQLLEKGYSINVLIRNPEHFTIQNPLVKVINGDVTDRAVLTSLLEQCDVVISTLGIGIPNSAPTIFSKATKDLIQIMKESGPTRYIVTTGLNVDTAFDQKGPGTKAATEWMYTNFPKSTADRQLEYEALAESNIEWTLVRLPIIDQTDIQEEVTVSLEDSPGAKISATSLALFLIDQIDDATYLRKAPFIANLGHA